MKKWGLLLLVFLLACTPQSLEEFQKEADQICEEITEDLQEVTSKKELLQKASRLKRHYRRLTHLIGKLDLFLQGTGGLIEKRIPSSSNQALHKELLRVYEIPGAKDILQRIQQESLKNLPKELSLAEITSRQEKPN